MAIILVLRLKLKIQLAICLVLIMHWKYVVVFMEIMVCNTIQSLRLDCEYIFTMHRVHHRKQCFEKLLCADPLFLLMAAGVPGVDGVNVLTWATLNVERLDPEPAQILHLLVVVLPALLIKR